VGKKSTNLQKFLNKMDSHSWQSQDLDNALKTFEAIQGEINYKHAQESLRNLVNRIDLSATEKAGLESEINQISKLIQKLEDSVVQIAAFGMVGRGKSSVLNALLGEEVFQAGALHGVTRSINSAKWQLTQEVIDQHEEISRVALPSLGKSQIQLIDTPGIDEVDGETREAMARKIAKQVDLILFIIAGDLTKVEYRALCQLREAGKPMLLIFNKIDQYPEADRLAIYAKIKDERVRELLTPDEIVMVAASPLVTQAVRRSDGSVKTQKVRGKPQIEELKLKILEILHREGKSLVALNSMLYAGEVNERLVERKMTIRDDSANALIQKAVMVKAVAIALNPVTVLDLFSGAVIDLGLILALSRLYGIPMTQQSALGLLQKIAITMGGISASEALASLGLSGIKTILGLSAPATGGLALGPYISVAITQAGVAGVSCYAIGQITKTYLANGASWGVDGPKAVVSRILQSLDEASIINRIKQELREKIF